jgi:hypothetical protein
MSFLKENEVVIAFFGGVLSVYIVARLLAPGIRNNIANGIANRITSGQMSTIGFPVISHADAVAIAGLPIADEVLSNMYLQ